jgi:hypothetical protein
MTAEDIYESGSVLRMVLTVGHEVGHSVQDKTDQLSIIDTRSIELGATCLAGAESACTQLKFVHSANTYAIVTSL